MAKGGGLALGDGEGDCTVEELFDILSKFEVDECPRVRAACDSMRQVLALL